MNKMEGNESIKAIDKLIANLNRIPKEVTSELAIKTIVEEVEKKLKKDLRRYNNYV